MRARVLDPPARLHAGILAALMRSGPQSRQQLAHSTGLDTSTIARTVPALAADGWVVESADRPVTPARGRPGKRVRVRDAHHLAVGVKIGPEKLTGAVTDIAGGVIVADSLPLSSREPDGVLGMVAEMAQALTRRGLELVDAADARVIGLGIGVGGHVVEGRLVVDSHILGWRQVDVSSTVARATGLPTVTLNDVNALAAGEHWLGAGRRVDDLAVITIGRGLGCGLVLGGRLHVGTSGSAGELGHLPLLPDGPLCGCGNRGCLEAVVSDQAVVAALRERLPGIDIRDFHDILRLAEAGNPVVLDGLARTGELLGRAVASVVNLVNPALVIIAGEMTSGMDFMEQPLRRATADHTFSAGWSECRLVIDRSGDELWARGAAWLAIRAAVRRPAILSRHIEVGG